MKRKNNSTMQVKRLPSSFVLLFLIFSWLAHDRRNQRDDMRDRSTKEEFSVILLLIRIINGGLYFGGYTYDGWIT